MNTLFAFLTAAIWIVPNAAWADASGTNVNVGETSAMNLRKEFESLATGMDAQSKSTPGQKLANMQRLLDGMEEVTRRREFTRLKDQPMKGPFEDVLAQAFVGHFLKFGDMESLKDLLSMNCPEYIAAIPSEFVLATSKQPDGITLLFRAYSTGATNLASQVALRCLHRAFPAIGRSSNSDRAFVAECESWWARNRVRITVNYEYPHVPGRAAPAPGSHSETERMGLFLLKE